MTVAILEESEPVVAVIDVVFGYCDCCRRPDLVGEVCIKGWQFLFRVCRNCFEQFGKAVEK